MLFAVDRLQGSTSNGGLPHVRHWHAGIIAYSVVVLLIFGANKLPEIGGGLGRAIRNFRRASSEPDEIDITPKEKKTDASSKDDSNKA